MKNLKQTSRLAVLSNLLLAVFGVTGCGTDITVEGMPNGGVDIVCIKGVEYYSSVKRLAPALKADGIPYTCDS